MDTSETGLEKIIVGWLVKEDKVPSSLITGIPTSSQFLGHGIPFLIEKWNNYLSYQYEANRHSIINK